MKDSNLGDLSVRISVVGHASPQWRGAASAAEAVRLNQGLSELRAQTVGKAVEEIVRRELPGMRIEIPAKGVGSQERFPTVSENNAAVDRSVMVTIELTTTRQTVKIQPHGPRRIYADSTIWSMTVKSMVRTAAMGAAGIFLKIAIKNLYSGKEIILSGFLFGGQLASSVKDSFKWSKTRKPDPKTVGSAVIFETEEALDFGFWSRQEGVVVTVMKDELSFGLKTMATGLMFRGLDTTPAVLVFDHKTIGLGMPGVDIFAVSGRLSMEGSRPSDMIDLPNYPDIVPTQATSQSYSGLLLSFPTGKAGLNDLTPGERKNLTEFVTNRARAIATLSGVFKTSGG